MQGLTIIQQAPQDIESREVYIYGYWIILQNTGKYEHLYLAELIKAHNILVI